MSAVGYGATLALCGTCHKPLQKSQARWDGEPTFVGYDRCPEHPRAEAHYVPVQYCEPNQLKETSMNKYGTVYAGGKEVGVVNEDFRVVQELPAPTVSLRAMWKNRFGQKMFQFLIRNKKEFMITLEELQALKKFMDELTDRVPCVCATRSGPFWNSYECPHCNGNRYVTIAP